VSHANCRQEISSFLMASTSNSTTTGTAVPFGKRAFAMEIRPRSSAGATPQWEFIGSNPVSSIIEIRGLFSATKSCVVRPAPALAPRTLSTDLQAFWREVIPIPLSGRPRAAFLPFEHQSHTNCSGWSIFKIGMSISTSGSALRPPDLPGLRTGSMAKTHCLTYPPLKPVAGSRKDTRGRKPPPDMKSVPCATRGGPYRRSQMAKRIRSPGMLVDGDHALWTQRAQHDA